MSQDWREYPKEKPTLGQKVLIFRQGYGQPGNYWEHIKTAVYIKDPYDGRKRSFADDTAVEIGNHEPWVYSNVTHWAPIERPKNAEKVLKKRPKN